MTRAFNYDVPTRRRSSPEILVMLQDGPWTLISQGGFSGYRRSPCQDAIKVVGLHKCSYPAIVEVPHRSAPRALRAVSPFKTSTICPTLAGSIVRPPHSIAPTGIDFRIPLPSRFWVVDMSRLRVEPTAPHGT